MRVTAGRSARPRSGPARRVVSCDTSTPMGSARDASRRRRRRSRPRRSSAGNADSTDVTPGTACAAAASRPTRTGRSDTGRRRSPDDRRSGLVGRAHRVRRRPSPPGRRSVDPARDGPPPRRRADRQPAAAARPLRADRPCLSADRSNAHRVLHQSRSRLARRRRAAAGGGLPAAISGGRYRNRCGPRSPHSTSPRSRSGTAAGVQGATSSATSPWRPGSGSCATSPSTWPSADT